jgi:hypothetical protein
VVRVLKIFQSSAVLPKSSDANVEQRRRSIVSSCCERGTEKEKVLEENKKKKCKEKRTKRKKKQKPRAKLLQGLLVLPVGKQTKWLSAGRSMRPFCFHLNPCSLRNDGFLFSFQHTVL